MNANIMVFKVSNNSQDIVTYNNLHERRYETLTLSELVKHEELKQKDILKASEYVLDCAFEKLKQLSFEHNKTTLYNHLVNFGYTPRYSGKDKCFYVKDLNEKHVETIKEYFVTNINIKNDNTNNL